MVQSYLTKRLEKMLQTNGSAVKSFLLIAVFTPIFSTIYGFTPLLTCTTADIASEHQKFILSGVKTILLTSVAGTISLLNENSFPILAGFSDGISRAHVAATEFRAGRIVAYSHTNSFIYENISAEYDNYQLLVNSISWVGRNLVRKIGVYPNWEFRQNILSEHGFQVQLISETNINNYTYLQQFDVLIVHNMTTDVDVVTLRTYIANGGGMIIAATPWSNYNPYGMKSFWGNVLLQETGLFYIGSHLTYGSINCNGVLGGCFNASTEYLKDTHAYHVWNDFKQYTWNQTHLARNRLHQMMMVLDDRLRYGPSDDILNNEIQLVYRQVPTFVPTEAAPVTEEYQKVFLLIHRYLCDFLNIVGLASQIRAHPSAVSFPGNEVNLKYERLSHVIQVNATHPSWTDDWDMKNLALDKINASTDNPIVEETLKTIQINTTRSAWHSTGLYARPGEEIVIQVLTADEVELNLDVQIGAHSDNIEHQSSWKRCPHIVFRNRIEGNHTNIANPFGGLIYINLNGYRKNLLQLSILGGIESPSYIMGVTLLSQWRNEIRNNPAPWGELVGENLIILAKNSFMSQLNDPEAIIDFWNRVLDAISDLAAIPREKNRAERFVTDVQISVGHMHAGYPIMYDINFQDVPLNVSVVARQQPQWLWGFFHELGHNHQKSDWTFSFAVEVTCNLFTLYAMNTVLFIPTNETHPNLSDYDVKQSLRQYIENGKKFTEWKTDPFLALITYIQLQEAFGWSAYRRVFANYGELTEAERPHSDQEKMDLWMIMFSQVVDENLSAFFISWGFPISSKAVARVSYLPSTTLRINGGLY